MKSIFIKTIVLFLTQLSLYVSRWEATDCTNDNEGNGWDKCLCEETSCKSCTDPDYTYTLGDYERDNHCCHKKCMKCSDEKNADTCDIAMCSDGYYYDFVQMDCIPCMDQCFTCNNSSSCKECKLNSDRKSLDFQKGFGSYFNTDSGNCELISCGDHCDYCQAEVDWSNNLQITCRVCRRYWQQNTQMYKAYFVNPNGGCQECQENCEFCIAKPLPYSGSYCKECANSNVINHFSVEELEEQSKDYMDLYMIYYGDSHQDYIFSKVYYLSEDNECLACPDDCLDCEYNNGIHCVSCKEKNQYVNAEKNCQNCPEGCLECEYKQFQNSLKCISCDIGYGFDENTKLCRKCEEKCTDCIYPIGSGYFCNQCELGSYRNPNLGCVSCPVTLCPSCRSKQSYNHNLFECTACANPLLQDVENNCCPYGCKTCTEKEDGSFQCLKCTDSRRFNDPKTNCVDGYIGKYLIHPMKCEEGYYLKITETYTTCRKCPDICTNCIENEITKELECKECTYNENPLQQSKQPLDMCCEKHCLECIFESNTQQQICQKCEEGKEMFCNQNTSTIDNLQLCYENLQKLLNNNKNIDFDISFFGSEKNQLKINLKYSQLPEFDNQCLFQEIKLGETSISEKITVQNEDFLIDLDQLEANCEKIEQEFQCELTLIILIDRQEQKTFKKSIKIPFTEDPDIQLQSITPMQIQDTSIINTDGLKVKDSQQTLTYCQDKNCQSIIKKEEILGLDNLSLYFLRVEFSPEQNLDLAFVYLDLVKMTVNGIVYQPVYFESKVKGKYTIGFQLWGSSDEYEIEILVKRRNELQQSQDSAAITKDTIKFSQKKPVKIDVEKTDSINNNNNLEWYIYVIIFVGTLSIILTMFCIYKHIKKNSVNEKQEKYKDTPTPHIQDINSEVAVSANKLQNAKINEQYPIEQEQEDNIKNSVKSISQQESATIQIN